MKNRKRLAVAMVAMALVMVFQGSISAQAAAKSVEWTKSSSSSFKKKWSATKTWTIENEDGLYVSVVYGYDTFGVNEDYVTKCKGTLGHKAAVKNSKGTSKNDKKENNHFNFSNIVFNS